MLYDGNGNIIETTGESISALNSLYSAPDRIVAANAILSANAISVHDTVSVVEYVFPAGSVFWLGDRQSGVSTYWLYSNQIDFAVGDTPPSGNIIARSYFGQVFLTGCAAYGGEYISAVESEGYVFTALKDLYLYVPDTVLIVREPTEDFLSIYRTAGNTLANGSGFFMWGDEYEGAPSGKLSYQDLLETSDAEIAHSERFRSIDRSVRDKELYLFMTGDSIVYGASNAGINCYRTIVPAHFNAPNSYLAVSGACTTTGYGMSWGENTGYSGYSAELDKLNGARCALYNLVVYAAGTNDWGNNAPLGTIADTDDTTFYGALRMTYDKLMERFPNAAFIVMIPFKRENWNTQNEAGHYLQEYCQAIYEVLNLRKYRHFYILDLFDKWFLDWDNETMRSHWFIDYVHPTKEAHICIARALEDKISEIMSIEGISKVAPTE